jgi:hypothetical protein
MAWFSRFFRKPAPVERRIEIEKRDPLRITIAEWRADPGLVEMAFKALHDPTVRRMLDVLWHDSYLRRATVLEEPPEKRIGHIDETRGFILAVCAFENLGKLEQPKKAPPMDFAAENAALEDKDEDEPTKPNA